MIRFKHKLIICAAFALVLLLLLVVFFYRPTRVALERAESFQFQRMQVTKVEENGASRFYYATNRRQISDKLPPEERFSTQRGEVIRFGSFDTEIHPTLGLGMVINPSEWLQNEEIKFQETKVLEQQKFINDLRTLVLASPQKSLLVVVHGFKESLASSMRKTAFFSHVLDINSPVMFFDWPGNQGNLIPGYRQARQVAKDSGAELARTLEIIINEIKPQRLWLVANSMGAQVVVNAFSDLYSKNDFADAAPEFEDVVLTAPDVGHEEFNQRFKLEIAALSRNLTVYVSSNDRALLTSRIVNRVRRLGESSLDPSNPNQYEEAVSVSELIDPGSELISLVDVTPVNRTRNFHNFSLETPEFFDDLYLRLINDKTPHNRLVYRVETPDNSVFWVLTRSR